MKREIVINQQRQPFYYDKLHSDLKLATGNSRIQFFKRAEEEKYRNYNGETNPFPTGDGRILSLGAKLFAEDYGAIQITPSTTEILNAMAKLINSGEIEMEVGQDVVHRDVMTTLIPPIPYISKPENQGTPNDVIRPAVALVHQEKQSEWIKKSNQNLILFEAPLPVRAGVSVSVTLTFKGGFTIPAELNNYILRMELGAEVHTSRGTALRK